MLLSALCACAASITPVALPLTERPLANPDAASSPLLEAATSVFDAASSQNLVLAATAIRPAPAPVVSPEHIVIPGHERTQPAPSNSRKLASDGELGQGWCLGLTYNCTLYEATGLASVLLFYCTVIIATCIHGVAQHQKGTASINEEATRRLTTTEESEDWQLLFSLLLYFFTFAAGMLVWVAAGVRWVHPFQSALIQYSGSVLLAACAILFVVAHTDMGDSWSPEPEQKTRHRLVTHGLFQWARHPMYAIFLWAAVGTLLATLNWVVFWVVSGTVLLTLRRIPAEERILTELFGQQYVSYSRRVSALGPPWTVLGYDPEMSPLGTRSPPPSPPEASDASSYGREYHVMAGEDESEAAAQVAAEREAATHGCCCACCTLRMEIWACFAIDLSSILGLALEIPGWAAVPARLHAVDLLTAYLVFSAFSAGATLFALTAGRRSAWPRRALVRLMSVKLPIFVVAMMGYFALPPYAAPLAQWVCANDFQGMRSALGGDEATCARMFPWLSTANNAPYIFAYAYSLKAAHDWFRCHPGNDSKGIWLSRGAASHAATSDLW